jgi:hypothetical protein
MGRTCVRTPTSEEQLGIMHTPQIYLWQGLLGLQVNYTKNGESVNPASYLTKRAVDEADSIPREPKAKSPGTSVPGLFAN